MTDIDYNELVRGLPQTGPSVKPLNRPMRGMNSALHGAGTSVAPATGVPKEQPKQYGSGESYAPAADRAPSSKSEQWLRSICEERQLPGGKGRTGDEQAAAIIDRLDRGAMSQADVSRGIDLFKDCPRKGAPAQARIDPVEAEHAVQTARVVTYLQDREAKGTINEFGQSLLDQFRSRGRLSEKQVGAILRWLPDSPSGPKEASPALPSVPTGRYAVESADGTLTFYRVKNAKDGRVFIHLKHGNGESEVPFTVKGYTTILQSIVNAGPLEAALRYGRELGCCSVCASDLTNRLSRELGIGPVCGGRYYDDPTDWTKVKKAARTAIRARGEDPDENVGA